MRHKEDSAGHPGPERPGSSPPSAIRLCRVRPGRVQPRLGRDVVSPRHMAGSSHEVLSAGQSEWPIPTAARLDDLAPSELQ